MTPSRTLPIIVPMLALNLIAGCARDEMPALPPLAASAEDRAAVSRVNGSVASPSATPPIYQYGSPAAGTAPTAGINAGPGPYTLDFTDTDIRAVSAQILGNLLHVNYAIDPAVHGSATLHTTVPLTGRTLLPTLQTLLASVGAVVIPDQGLYRVVPATAAGAAGSLIMPLRYVSAEDLGKVLQPLAGTAAKIAPEVGLNALLISGDPAQVQAMRDLVQSFDRDELSHQSYAVLPVSSGNARDMADALQEAFHGKSGGALAGLVRVVPLTRMNAVLIVSSQPRYIDAARDVFSVIDRQRRNTARSWHVYYLQNSNANNIAYTLQMAFTPNNVTAVPDSQQPGGGRSGQSGGTGGGMSGSLAGGSMGGGTLGGGVGGASGGGGSFGAGSGLGSGGGTGGLSSPTSSGPDSSRAVSSSPVASAGNPLLGGLDSGSSSDATDSMRILPNNQNNALLIYGTQQEEDQVTGMLRKVDIMPLQVRIDATIAEVTLNDSLQYGTQFFFKSGGLNGILNTGTSAVTTPSQVALNSTFPGFLLAGNGQGGAPFALQALQAVTTVNVLSSPEVTVVDNQEARLQVGALVPYLQSSSQSTVTTGAPVINSIGYQPTGVILQVTPRVNSGGLVTLDISQEVSEVAAALTTAGIQSPTFTERNVESRVVVQDGQTVGMAGLIQDSISKGNQGIPWLKDIPILGVLAGTQNNSRQRTELLVLITPHVIRNQSDMRQMTEDMREALPQAAATPYMSAAEPVSGSADPNGRLIAKTRRYLQKHLDP
jgi:general secretion pathway protein D